ncbi:hypothetical protein AMTR_s00029p00123460 [Amborella trichopoda]|uniref:Rhodanese domain-containing protein n=2 Tax=Amborella trichopoda TaxID=13333 RepID=W1PQL5_AMBTC|nr:hypothetical protein AMTR_s00029p00123460 [Amborella trichopoda]
MRGDTFSTIFVLNPPPLMAIFSCRATLFKTSPIFNHKTCPNLSIFRGLAANAQQQKNKWIPTLGFSRTRIPALNFQNRIQRSSVTKNEASALRSEKAEGFIVVNFYRFVCIENPEEEVTRHRLFLQGRDIQGRIYLNEQGINAQYSGPSEDALAYVEWLKDDSRFSDILVQTSPAMNGHAFPQLKLRYKPSLVQMEGGISHLPLVNPAMRAIPLSPSEWRNRLDSLKNVEGSSSREDTGSDQKSVLLLDVRNGYEWDIGHFHGTQRPDVNCFRSTLFGLTDMEVSPSDPLAGIDREATDILMYCTGGIRCDVYSTMLRQRGFQNLYTLKGGVSHYLEKEGPAEWVGNLFVFDSRLSLPPSAYKPEAISNGYNGIPHLNPTNEGNNTFLRCRICGSFLSEYRHRNCANLDCNLLFLSCSDCVRELKGCCSMNCTSAPRLRPVLPGHRRYEKWHVYRDAQCPHSAKV